MKIRLGRHLTGDMASAVAFYACLRSPEEWKKKGRLQRRFDADMIPLQNNNVIHRIIVIAFTEVALKVLRNNRSSISTMRKSNAQISDLQDSLPAWFVPSNLTRSASADLTLLSCSRHWHPFVVQEVPKHVILCPLHCPLLLWFIWRIGILLFTCQPMLMLDSVRK